MKLRYILLFIIILGCVVGCTKKDIVVENTIITPDLNNPIMQKISNQTWYKNPSLSEGQVKFVWETTENMPSPSEAMASLLYTVAFQNITFNRDGTSNMTYIPPFFPNVYIHNKGTWQVGTTEENSIILNTKTPVSNTTAKAKVINLEAKDQLSTLNLSMDFGHRLMDFRFVNASFVTNNPVKAEAENYRWFEKQEILTTSIQAKDITGTWSTAGIEPLDLDNFKKEDIIRVSHIEDLLLSTPTFITGQLFDLKADGTALIAYKLFETFLSGIEDEIPDGKTVVSNAKWEVKGNKIFIKTDEALFYSLGEYLFHLPVYANGLTKVGQFGDLPIRIQKNRYYSIELIEQTESGFWSRVTTNDAIFYAFLFKSAPLDNGKTINVKNAF